jgi:hypothetical protein
MFSRVLLGMRRALLSAVLTVTTNRENQTMKNHGQSTNAITRNLANAQTLKAYANPPVLDSRATVYRVYVANVDYAPFLPYLTANGIEGATILSATGIWQGSVERSNVVEIIGTFADRNKVVQFASALAHGWNQSEVLVTWQNARTFETVTVYGR